MKRFRIQLVIAGIVFICGVSLMGLVYILFNKQNSLFKEWQGIEEKKEKLKRKETYKFNTKDNYSNSEDTVEYGKIVKWQESTLSLHSSLIYTYI